jgi:predicted MFS family arabinose efflux permease
VRLLVVSMIARLVHDAAQRVVYPFLPEIAAGLRVPIDEMGRTLSLRSGMSLLSPLFGRLSDRVGHRRAMSVALALLAIGLGCVGAADGLAGATAGFVLFGIATAVYTPALMAYVSERTPYARRGRVIGAIEMTWAISGMVSVPLLGTLIGPLGWRAPFVTLAVAAAVCAALTLLLEETRPAVRATGEPFRIASIVRNRSALSFLLATFLIFFGFENIQVGYASWFESRFGLSAEARGWMQTAFGVFEIMASAGTSLFLDRIGKKRGMSGGLIVVLSAYVLLITVGPQALWLALASLCVAFLGFEFSVVAGIPIASEQIPQARGTMLAMLTMVTGLGRMIGAASGSAWIAGAGFIAAASMSAALAVVTVVVFVRGVKEQPSTDLKRTALAKSAQGQGG